VSGRQIEQSVHAPVEYRNVPPGLEITGTQADTVYVHLRGPDSELARLEPGDVRATLDLSDAKATVNGTFALRTDQIVVPFGVQVMWVEPGHVVLTLETVGWLEVPVVPAVLGKPAAGFVEGAVTVDPATVVVEGPEEQLQRVRAATTEPVSIEGATAPVTASVGIGVPDAVLRLREPRKARVTVQIDHRSGGE
jgi:YbbR domain-containing protein